MKAKMNQILCWILHLFYTQQQEMNEKFFIYIVVW